MPKGGIEVLVAFALGKVNKYKRYRLRFYNFMISVQEELGILLKKEMQSRAIVDTGTMRKRTDYKVLAWDMIAFGIFEPKSKYYDSGKHKPTGNVSKYTGQVIPPDKSYAEFPYKRDRYVIDVVNRMYHKELRKRIKEFNKEHL